MLDVAQNIAPSTSSFAAVRVQRLKTMPQLKSASLHANREDEISKLRARPGANRLDNLAFNPWDEERRHEPNFDYVVDFKKMKDAVGVGERNGTAPITHMICVISPEWIAETGDVHDPQNLRNRQLFEAGIAWAKENFGEQALISARLDLDENGAGVVDVFVAPTARTKKGKLYLSVSPRLKQIQRHYKARNTFSGLQDSWAEWVQQHLDPSIKRGKEKESKGPDRISPENYRARAENEKERKKLDVERQAITLQRDDLANSIDQAEIAKKEIDESRRALDESGCKLDERLAKIHETEERQHLAQARIDDERANLESRRASLERQSAVDREAARRQGLQDGRNQAKAEVVREFEIARSHGLAQGRAEASEEARVQTENIQIVTNAVIADEIRGISTTRLGAVLEPNLAPKRRDELVAALKPLSPDSRTALAAVAAAKRQQEEKARKEVSEIKRNAEKLYLDTHQKAMKEGFTQAAQLIGDAFRLGLLALLENRIKVARPGEGPDRKFEIVAMEGQKDEDHQKLLEQIAPALDYGLINLLMHIALVFAQMKEFAAEVKKQMSASLRMSAERTGPER